jgi:hypothetical protein
LCGRAMLSPPPTGNDGNPRHGRRGNSGAPRARLLRVACRAGARGPLTVAVATVAAPRDRRHGTSRRCAARISCSTPRAARRSGRRRRPRRPPPPPPRRRRPRAATWAAAAARRGSTCQSRSRRSPSGTTARRAHCCGFLRSRLRRAARPSSLSSFLSSSIIWAVEWSPCWPRRRP